MTLKAWQEQVDDWIKTIGVRYFDVMTNSLLLSEEVGEFNRVVARHYGEQSFKKAEDAASAKDQLKEELADIIFVATCLANQMDINLTEVLQKSIQKKTRRDKTRHIENEKLK